MKATTSAIIVMSLLLSTTPAHITLAAVDTNDSIDFTGFTVNVPCANGGAGEDVVFEGSLHVLSSIMQNKNGLTVTSHFQPQGLQGIGQTTGDKYNATGITREVTSVSKSATDTFVNNFRMIGQGPGNNFLIHETFHVTINANGTVTASHDTGTVDCK